MHEIPQYNVKGVTCTDEPAENHLPSLYFPSAPQRFLLSFSRKLFSGKNLHTYLPAQQLTQKTNDQCSRVLRHFHPGLVETET